MRYRVGINGGMATGELTAAEFAKTVKEFSPRIEAFAISDGQATLEIIGAAPAIGTTYTVVVRADRPTPRSGTAARSRPVLPTPSLLGS